MTKGIGIRSWIAALALTALTASSVAAEEPSTVASEMRQAVVATVERSAIQLATAQQEQQGQEEVGAAARTPAPPPDSPEVGPAEPTPPFPAPPERGPRGNRRIVRFGADYTVEANEMVEELVVFGGTATIHGEVVTDLAVIGGSAAISETGKIGGDLVVIGGNVTVGQGAQVDGDMVVVGGGIDSPAGFVNGGEQVVAGNIFGGADLLAAAIPWVSRGLLWGRLIVPDLTWIWSVVAALLALYLLLNLLFDGTVRACAQTLGRKPLTTFLVGLLVLLLVGPASFMLMVSVIGLAIVPFLWAALAVAGLLGSVAVSRWIGETIVRPDVVESRLQAAGALLVGFTIIVLASMVPVIGLVASASLGVFAIGAASISVVDGLRRENPNLASSPPQPPHGGSFPEAQATGPRGRPMSAESPPSPSESPESDTVPVTADLAVFPRATFLIRAGAFVLDVLLVALLNGLLVFTNGGAFFLLLLAYHIAFWSWKGTTVGGIICQLRVVRTDGQPPRFTDAFVRGLSSIFSAVVLGLGWFWVLKDPERQSWHDKIAGTYVVSVPRNHPLP